MTYERAMEIAKSLRNMDGPADIKNRLVLLAYNSALEGPFLDNLWLLFESLFAIARCKRCGSTSCRDPREDSDAMTARKTLEAFGITL